MTERHHPLPSDDRARHDRIPESVEDEREVDEGGPRPSTTEPPGHDYREPDGLAIPDLSSDYLRQTAAMTLPQV